MPTLEPVDASFAHNASHQVAVTRTVDATPTEVWEVLSDHGSWDAWFPEMTRCEAAAPGRLGATRTVKIGPLVAAEQWVIWEPQRALGFTVTHTNLPMARRILEQIELDAIANGPPPRTRIRYQGFYQPHPLTRFAFARSKRRIERSWGAALVSLDGWLASGQGRAMGQGRADAPPLLGPPD